MSRSAGIASSALNWRLSARPRWSSTAAFPNNVATSRVAPTNGNTTQPATVTNRMIDTNAASGSATKPIRNDVAPRFSSASAVAPTGLGNTAASTI